MRHTQSAAPSGWNGFSLIELLVVVSIISILATIAVPNFINAQMRAKLARMKADMRAMAVAIEAYRTDNQNYPFRRNTLSNGNVFYPVPETIYRLQQMSVLTTPIAYITKFPVDIFEMHLQPPFNVIDYWDPTQVAWMINSIHFARPWRKVKADAVGWLLVSVGPDQYIGSIMDVGGWPWSSNPVLRGTLYIPYDPTNGLDSMGNIYSGQKGGVEKAGPMVTEWASK